jgi:hypothetical protein
LGLGVPGVGVHPDPLSVSDEHVQHPVCVIDRGDVVGERLGAGGAGDVEVGPEFAGGRVRGSGFG